MDAFCCTRSWPDFARVPAPWGFRPSDENTWRYLVSMQHVREGDAWDLSSLSVDRPPIEPSQYVSVPPKHPDKMGFDEVRNLTLLLPSSHFIT